MSASLLPEPSVPSPRHEAHAPDSTGGRPRPVDAGLRRVLAPLASLVRAAHRRGVPF